MAFHKRPARPVATAQNVVHWGKSKKSPQDFSAETREICYNILKQEEKMSYEMVMEKVKTLPETALEEVSVYLDKIGSIYQARQNVDFSFVDNIFGTLSDSEADELRSCCSLKFKENA